MPTIQPSDFSETYTIRLMAGRDPVTDRTPIVRVAGSSDPPVVRGRSAYHTTPSGKTIVRYPAAYGWRTLYHPSTLRIEVGEDWEPPALRRDDSGRPDPVRDSWGRAVMAR